MPAIPNDLDDCKPMTVNDLLLELERVLKTLDGESPVNVCNSKLGTMALRVRKVTVSAGDVCIWGDYRNP